MRPPLLAQGSQVSGHQATHWNHVGAFTAAKPRSWLGPDARTWLSPVQIQGSCSAAQLLTGFVARALDEHAVDLDSGAVLT